MAALLGTLDPAIATRRSNPRPALALALSLALLLSLTLGLSTPAGAAGASFTAGYAISLGGTHVASADLHLVDNGERYTMSFEAKISGFAQLVASGLTRAASAGVSTPTGLQSEKFDLTTRSGGEDLRVAITFSAADVESFVITPPLLNHIGRVAIERRHLVDVNDILAAFMLRGTALDRTLCNRKARIFTGIERFDVAVRYLRDEQATSSRAAYQGPVILCAIAYSPVSGHFTASEITRELAGSDRILVWYAPLEAPGYFIPYRVLLTTSSGDLSMVLTALEQ